MGLLQAYAVYRYGKRKAEKRQRADDDFWSEICTFCGHERRQHSRDGREACPSY